MSAKEGGGRAPKQPTGDSVGREDAGFVNTGRKERKQVGRWLEHRVKRKN